MADSSPRPCLHSSFYQNGCQSATLVCPSSRGPGANLPNTYQYSKPKWLGRDGPDVLCHHTLMVC